MIDEVELLLLGDVCIVWVMLVVVVVGVVFVDGCLE